MIAYVRRVNLYSQVFRWANNWGIFDINSCGSFFLDWPDSPEKHLSISCLEGKDLVTDILVAKWGRGLGVSVYGVQHAYGHLIFLFLLW